MKKGSAALLAACAAIIAAMLAAVLHVPRARAAEIPTTYSNHMEMTLHAPEQPGDRARADAIVAAAREVVAEYPTVEAAERAGFRKFLTGVKLPIEHYTNRHYAVEAWLGRFDPHHPTSLIFERQGDSLHIVGVMYTASNAVDQNELNARVPLSFGTWHRHVDFCRAPLWTPLSQRFGPNARFGFEGSIHTRAACHAAGGTFIPRVFGWMVHVWPMGKTQAAIWAVDAQNSMRMQR